MRCCASAGAAFRGALRYEYTMQVRRWGYWVAVLGLVGFNLLASGFEYRFNDEMLSLQQATGFWMQNLCFFVPLIAGLYLADRLARDRTGKVAEILETTGAGPAPRLWGKYLGACCAALTPIAAVWIVCVVALSVHYGTAGGAAWGLAAYALIAVPAILFMGALSMVAADIVGPLVARVLLVGYWFWGNFVPPDVMPTLSDTWLAPVGKTAGVGFFAVPIYRQASVGDGVASVLLLIGIAGLIVLGYQAVRTRRVRRQ
jgi:ABC-type multidrug transport system permease subunit